MRNLASRPDRPTREFTLVLSGGGARGFAHAGVLRGLDLLGFRPSAIVGVSMGAVIATSYASRADWYPAVVALDTEALPRPLRSRGGTQTLLARLSWPARFMRTVWQMFFGWGVGTTALAPVRALFDKLTLHSRLESGRVALAICATDLVSGRRVVLRTGPTSDAVHASVALAGIAPPLARGAELLADGVYTDIAPIDVARTFGHEIVIAVDPGQELVTGTIENGFDALLRAVEICQLHHADLRFAMADLVIRPPFLRTIDTLDFDAKRECIAAGIRAVRLARREIAELLIIPPDERP